MKKFNHCKVTAIVLTVVAVLLMVAGFFVPPMGVIDGSVLTASGIMLGFAALFFAWHAVDKGMDAKVTHGSTSIEISNDESDEG